jgi:hydroxymethylpyrimidine/phosphomethylpyrimidine kinase
MSEDVPVALTIAGSDSGGGAGIQMDLKVFAALGVFGTCAVTALTAQNTVGVRGAWEAPPEFVGAQIEAVLDDLPVGAAKTGMLSSAAVVEAVVRVVGELRERGSFPPLVGERGGFPPLVVDPVVVAKDGTHLLSEEGIAAVREGLLPLADVLTPNVPEAEALAGVRIKSEEDLRRGAEKLRALGCSWVLVKGGHMEGREVTDLLLGPDHEQALSSPRVPGGPFHGTGCALSAATAAFLAHGRGIPEAVCEGRAFVQDLLQAARSLGGGARVLHPQHYSPSKGSQQ